LAVNSLRAAAFLVTAMIAIVLVEGSIRRPDIIVALANYSASFNGNHATLPCPGAAPKHGVGAFSFYSRAANTRPLSIGTISVASPSLLG
jgi:hypothetical protein